MDWSTPISMAAILIFLWLMMRGCGGMMAGGGCGMGRHSHSGSTDLPQRRHDDGSQAHG
jgi:hypothetical protein